MEDVRLLVVRARDGDLEAYGELVRRFEHMAYGYAYSVLRDFDRAEDVAQCAFIHAYRELAKLRRPEAFPGWLRRIVATYCNRLLRRKAIAKLSLSAAAEVASDQAGPAEEAERAEIRETVAAAIHSLPEGERTATTLHYINGYSQKEIARFLEVPVTTVNGRLRTARRHLKERMIGMVEEEFGRRPLPKNFARSTVEFESQCHPLRFAAVEGPCEATYRRALKLEVNEVLGSSAAIAPGEKFVVRGRYELHGADVAWLGLVINGASRGHWEDLSTGAAEFELRIEVLEVGAEGAERIGILMCDGDWRELGVRLDVVEIAR